MLLKPIADRLKVEVPAFRNNVTGAADFAAAREGLKSVPAAFVLPLMDKAEESDTQDESIIIQHVKPRFGVLLVVSNVRDTQGANANDENLQPLRDAVLYSLLGWQPSAGYSPLQYGGGRMLALNGTDLWWQEDYLTGYYLKRTRDD